MSVTNIIFKTYTLFPILVTEHFTYEFQIPEMSPGGTEIGSFVITDPDIDQNHSITFLSQDESQLFAIDGSKLLVIIFSTVKNKSDFRKIVHRKHNVHAINI